MSEPSRGVAIVTGGARGIGAAVASRLGADGFHVIVNYVSSHVQANAVVQEIVRTGGHATAIQTDVSDSAAVRALFDHAEGEFGGADVLVANAGVQTLGVLSEVPDEDFDRLVRINLKGMFNVLREAAARLRAHGRIVSLSSGAVLVRQPRYGVYAATKAGVDALTAVLAKEMRGRSVTVNSVMPGPVATELFLKDKTGADLQRAALQSPLERLGEPIDIASVVSFLAGPDGAWVNGQTLVANGAFV